MWLRGLSLNLYGFCIPIMQKPLYWGTDFVEAHQSVTTGINSSHSSYRKFRYFPTSKPNGYPLFVWTYSRDLITTIFSAGEVGASLFQWNESFDLLCHSFCESEAHLRWALSSGYNKKTNKVAASLCSFLEMGFSSILSMIVVRIHFLAAVGLRSLSPCWLLAGTTLSSWGPRRVPCDRCSHRSFHDMAAYFSRHFFSGTVSWWFPLFFLFAAPIRCTFNFYILFSFSFNFFLPLYISGLYTMQFFSYLSCR